MINSGVGDRGFLATTGATVSAIKVIELITACASPARSVARTSTEYVVPLVNGGITSAPAGYVHA